MADSGGAYPKSGGGKLLFWPNFSKNCIKTRMHSSRMRTGHSLTVFRSLLLLGGVLSPRGCTYSREGVYLVPGGVWSQGGMSSPGGCLVPGASLVLGGACLVPGGACLVPGGACLVPGGVSGGGVCLLQRGGLLVRYSPPVNRMTDRCKNITLAKTSFRPVMKKKLDQEGARP